MPDTSPLSPAKVVRRATLARATRREQQVYPIVTRNTFKNLPNGTKRSILVHAEKITAKLRRDLGEGHEARVITADAPSPGSTVAVTASAVSSPEAAAAAPSTPPRRVIPRRHPHPRAWTPATGESGNQPADDPSRDGSRGHALWPSPIPFRA